MNVLERLNTRERTILYALLAIVGVSLIYGFLIEPFFKRYKDINREANLVENKLQRALLIIKNKDNIDKEYATYAERLKSEGSDEEEMTSMLNGLEILARNTNLRIVNMKPQAVEDKEFYKRFAVEIETESDMAALMRFIYDVKNSPILLKIDRLNLNTKTSQSGIIIVASMVISRVSIR